MKIFKKIQNHFNPFFKKRGSRNKSQQTKNKNLELKEEDLYSLDEYQLNNLLDKKVVFHFFSLDAFSEKDFLPPSYKTAQIKTKEEILSQFKDQDFKQPIILICKDGVKSKSLSQVLREKGFINCYFLKKGFLLSQ